MVLKSGAKRPASHINSTLRGASRSTHEGSKRRTNSRGVHAASVFNDSSVKKMSMATVTVKFRPAAGLQLSNLLARYRTLQATGCSSEIWRSAGQRCTSFRSPPTFSIKPEPIVARHLSWSSLHRSTSRGGARGQVSCFEDIPGQRLAK